VREAEVDIATKQVRVAFDEALLGREELVTAIEAQGFDVATRAE
jgi:copper chaperone CopZ